MEAKFKLPNLYFILLISNFLLLTSLSADFIRDDSKEVVLDTRTNLMWQDNNEAKNNDQNWSDAINYCENLTLGGYNDWHLPNYNELYYLANRSKYNPAIDSAFKNVASSFYWSSTTSASVTSSAWFVNFYYGYDNKNVKSYSFYVRCVRRAD